MNILGIVVLVGWILIVDNYDKIDWTSIKKYNISDPRSVILKDQNGLPIINEPLNISKGNIFIVRKRTGVSSKPYPDYIGFDVDKPVHIFIPGKGYCIEDTENELKFSMDYYLEHDWISFKNAKKAQKVIKENWKIPGLIKLQLRNVDKSKHRYGGNAN